MQRGVRVARLEHPLHRRELVEDLLEPQLVHLVDDDEQVLVVLGPIRAGLLQRQELVDHEVRGVGDGALGHEAMVGARSRFGDIG